MEDLKNIIESLLFVTEEPLTLDRIREVLELEDRRMIRETLNELKDDYAARTGAFVLREVAGGYQFRSRPEYVPFIKRLIQPKPSRLSRAALETLAIIAYKQPVIRSDVEHLRGVDCGGVLRMLLERKLIRVLGRKEIPGRPIIYVTTKQFLEVFDLKNLKDLPSPKEIEDLGKAPLEDPTLEEIQTAGPNTGAPEPGNPAGKKMDAEISAAENIAEDKSMEKNPDGQPTNA